MMIMQCGVVGPRSIRWYALMGQKESDGTVVLSDSLEQQSRPSGPAVA